MSALDFALTLKLVDQFTAPARAVAGAFRNVSTWARDLEQNPPDYSATVRRLQGLKDEGEKLRAMGKEIAIAGGATLVAGRKMAGAIGSMNSAANEYGYTLAMLGTAVPETFGSIAADIAAVDKAAKTWSASHQDSANDYARASLSMVSAGLATDKAIAGAGVALAVATATMGDGAAAAELLATVYNGVGDESADLSTEMMRLGDIVTKTQQYFQFKDMQQLSEGMKYALPASKQLRMDLRETTAVIGQLNNMGIAGSQAGTAFRASVFRMAEAAKKLGFEVAWSTEGGLDYLGTLENIRKKFGTKLDAPETQTALQDAFGIQAFTAVGGLLGQVDKLSVGIAQVRAGSGATADALAKLDATGSAAMKRLTNATINAKVAFGQALAPVLQPIIQGLTAILTKVSQWAAAHPALATALSTGAVVITALTLVIGGLLTAIGMSVMAFGAFKAVSASAGLQVLRLIPQILALNASLLANPIVLIVMAIIAAIAILGVAIWQIVKHWDAIKAAGAKALNWIGDKLKWVWNWIKGNWPKLLPILLGPLAPVVYAVLAIAKNWGAIKAAAAFAMGWVLAKVQAVWGWVKTNWPYLVPILLGPFAPLGYAVVLLIKNWQKVKDWVFSTVESIAGFLKALPERALTWAVGIGRAILAGLKSALGKVFDFVVNAGSQIVGYYTPDATASGVAFADTFAAGVRAGSPSATAAVAGMTNQVDTYMPHSNAQVGPLSRLSESGKAFSATWAGGIDDGAERATTAVAGMLGGLRVPDVKLSQSAVVQGASTGRQDSRRPSISIANLVISVSAKDVREAQDLGDLLQGLALEVG